MKTPSVLVKARLYGANENTVLAVVSGPLEGVAADLADEVFQAVLDQETKLSIEVSSGETGT